MIENCQIVEYSEMPDNIKDMLRCYYEGTDHRAILNDSYSRYPYLLDWRETDLTELDKWFIDNGAEYYTLDYLIIHWEW